MNKRNKKRTKEERIDSLKIIIDEYEFREKWGYKKAIDYYRNKVGIKVGNELYNKLLTRTITPEEFLESANEYINHNSERQKSCKAKDEILLMIQKIYELAKNSGKYIDCEINAERLFDEDSNRQRSFFQIQHPTSKRIELNITFNNL